jgi:hypothetical protein
MRSIKKPIDPIVEEFLIKECGSDRGIIPVGRKRRIARKVYRWAKAAFFGVPVMGFLLRDIAEELAYAGTEHMTRKIAWSTIAVFVPPTVSCIGLAAYKVTTNETIRKPIALITNVAGYCYTIPMWVTDHSVLYFVEQALFGAPVPLMPAGRVNIIPNQTLDTLDGEIATIVRQALQPYVDRS